MLTKKTKIQVCILCCCLLLAFAIGVYVIMHLDSMSTAVCVPDDGFHTDETMFFVADTLLLGKWQHSVDTTWYRIYTLEPAGDGYCWGREWNTSEDIYEEDLLPYGNGWFKWKKEEQAVIEFQMTDIQGAVIPYEYKVLKLDVDQLHYKENFSSKQHLFRKI